MGVETETYSFADLLSNIVDNRGKTCPVAEEGLPLIATNCVKNETLYPAFEKVRYVDEDTFANWFRGHPEPGDMIFVTKGSPGNVCWTPEPVNFCIAQDMVAIRSDSEIVDSKYLFALLRSPATQARILNMHVGTLIPHFKKGDFKNLYFDILADMGLQKEIGEIYFSFCEKIELNRQMNATLESMAQAMFKSWFVDFDPVIDNALAVGNPIPEPLHTRAEARKALGDKRKPLPETIQQRFPNCFVFNEEMGWLPEGWVISKFQEIAEVVMGQSPKGDTYNTEGEGMPLVNGPVEFGPYFTQRTKWTTAPTKLSEDQDLVVCVRGSTTGRFVKSDGVYCLGRGVCSIRGKRSQAFVDYTFKYHKDALLGMTTGSTFPNWSGPTLKGFSIIKPSDVLLDVFEELVGSLINKMCSNTVETENLCEIRDTLLPKLLSGNSESWKLNNRSQLANE
ncbi:MAG: restriction endonuclease subunit S [Candidatus Thiodiazotropha sp. (ex Gloverina cf. vestifex)]|nr:restriction endonuclease subunit S [Candidatus Thiodiazotropha sp. (ex Gloverina cf. vestifex)]